MDTMVDTTLQDGLHSLQGFSSELRWPNTQLPPTLSSHNAESFVPTHLVCTLPITFLSFFVPGASDSLPNNGADPLHPLHRDEERRCGRGDGHCESQSEVL